MTTSKTAAVESVSDTDLVAQCLTGDELAWSALIERYSALIYSVPMRQGYDVDFADEVFQSVVLTLVERLSLITSPQALPQWLIVTTRRRVTALSKKRRRELPESEREQVDSRNAQQALLQQEQATLLAEALAELSPRDRQVMHDLFVEELPYAEVAERHGLAIGSLGSLRARTLSRLRSKLESKGLATLEPSLHQVAAERLFDGGVGEQ